MCGDVCARAGRRGDGARGGGRAGAVGVRGVDFGYDVTERGDRKAAPAGGDAGGAE